MEIEYTIIPEDVAAFNRHYFKTSPSIRRSYWMGYFWGLLAAVMLFVIFTGWRSWWNAAFPLLFGVIYIIYYPLSVRRRINQAGQRLLKEGANKGIWGKHKIVITEDELVETSSFGEGRTRWAGVERVEENDDYIFIFLSTISAHVIAKRNFEKEQQAQEFYRLSRMYWERAQVSSA